MKVFTAALLLLVEATTFVAGLSVEQWRGQSVYQIVTDRFARKCICCCVSITIIEESMFSKLRVYSILTKLF